MSPYILLSINIFLGVAGQFLIKFGVNKLPGMDEAGMQKFLLSAGLSPFVISGIALYAFSSILWVVLLSELDLSVAYPALSIGYVLVLLVSMLFLGEQVSTLRFAGVFLIMAGIFIIFRS